MAAPVRRRPGTGSPLAVEVEPVRTPATVPEQPAAPAAEDAPVAPPAAAQRAKVEVAEAPAPAVERPRRAPTAASDPGPKVTDQADPKSAVTVQIRNSLRQRAQTAVLQTAGRAGGHRSFAALVDAALERELERLAREFNGGAPFERNAGEFRTGRPFGS